MPAVMADISVDPRLLNLELVLPLAAGLVAGISVIGLLRILGRSRPLPAPAAKASGPVSDPFVHGSATEHRKSLRRQGNPVEILIVNPTNQSAPFKGYVIDRCVGGLGLYVDGAFPPDQRLTVRPTHAPSMTPWVELIVKSCRQSDVGYELGCQFVKTPPWSVLLMFG
jgi:hypothetical protein